MWTAVSVRADSNHAAFNPSTGCAQYIVTDGGIHRNAARTPADSACPSNYTQVGQGHGGYNALQLYEVATQRQAGSWTDDIYIGTQDNNLWASIDGGWRWPGSIGAEGFGLQVVPHASDPGADTIVGQACLACYYFKTHRGFADRTSWNNAPVWINPATRQRGMQSNPVLIAAGVYAQISQNGPSDLRIYTTRDAGMTWTEAGRLPFFELRYPIRVVGPATDPVIFILYKRPPTRTSGSVDRTGLARIDGVLRGRALWTGVDGGLGSPDSFSAFCFGAGTFGCPTVYAVNPRNPNHILAADAADGSIKVTRDGYRWDPDTDLNYRLRGYGSSLGSLLYTTPNWSLTQVHVIAFHPRNTEIFVGTESQGVFYSENDGRTWNEVPNSRQIPNISGFAFGFEGDREREVIYVSSYGRGLWKLHRVPEPRLSGGGGGGTPIRYLPFYLDRFDPWQAYVVSDPITGGPLRFPIDPGDCPICLLALVDGGRIRELTVAPNGQVEKIWTDGKLLTFDLKGQPAKATFALESISQDGRFTGCPECGKIVGRGGEIGGVILEKGKLLGLVAKLSKKDAQQNSTTDVLKPFNPGQTVQPSTPPGPYIAVVGTVSGTGLPTAAVGDTLTVFGSGFCGKPDCGRVVLRVADEIVAADVKVRDDGSFEVSFTAKEVPLGAGFIGPYPVTATQRGPNQTVYTDSSRLMVARRETNASLDVTPEPPRDFQARSGRFPSR